MRRFFCLMLLSGAGFAQPLMTDRAAARFLDQATWGPTPESIAALENMGISDWLTAQFAAQPTDLPDQAILASNGNSNNNLTPVPLFL